jgi:hypothetical protein
MAIHANHDNFLRIKISLDIFATTATNALIIAAPNLAKN